MGIYGQTVSGGDPNGESIGVTDCHSIGRSHSRSDVGTNSGAIGQSIGEALDSTDSDDDNRCADEGTNGRSAESGQSDGESRGSAHSGD